MEYDDLTGLILKCAYKIHSSLGPGLLESVYETCLAYELKKEGIQLEQQKSMPLVYDDIVIALGYRLDLLVENKVIVEIKNVSSINEVHKAQLLTYLKLSNCHVGLILNFNVMSLKDGIKRLVY